MRVCRVRDMAQLDVFGNFLKSQSRVLTLVVFYELIFNRINRIFTCSVGY